MGTFEYNGKIYAVDGEGYLQHSGHWDEDFAEGMAGRVKITGGLTEKHWQVINYIRETYMEKGICPLVFQTCRANNLKISGLKGLFPTGYLRGACRLAGLTYKEGFIGQDWLADATEDFSPEKLEKAYNVNARGFLLDPFEWDEQFAVFKAFEMKMPGPLSERHWQIIYYLRESYDRDHDVPTVYETCEANEIEVDELQQLFPDGYHRGAVKIAGLRVK